MSFPFDLGFVVRFFKTGTYPVTRRTSGAYDTDGKFVPDAGTVINTDANVQPVTGRDLERLDEGRRARETLKFISETELFTEDKDANRAADNVVIDGYTWEVVNVERWSVAAGYYRMLLQKVTP